MAHGSKAVVLKALAANLGIGVVKLLAALFTRSGAMLAESIHSFADSGNQALLLIGSARAARPADERYPLGYGREAYFWAMLVAVILFTLGGGFSIYEGLHKLENPAPLKGPFVAIAVLLTGLLLEGYSLHAAWTECGKVRAGRSLLTWGRTTGDVDLLIVTFEDLAAMTGLSLALVAVVASWVTGDPKWDAIGSVLVGSMLLVVALFVGMQVRRLIVGFAADEAIQARLHACWDEHGFDVLRLIAVWAGPGRVLVSCKVRSRTGIESAAELIRRLNEAEAAARAAVPEIQFQFAEPDFAD